MHKEKEIEFMGLFLAPESYFCLVEWLLRSLQLREFENIIKAFEM